MDRRSIVWFRSDLRLHDNEALNEAARFSDQIIPVYVFDLRVFTGHTSFGFPKTGIHRARFILKSVRALRESLRKLGLDLIIRTGLPEEEVFHLAHQLKTNWVFCNRERTSEEVFVQDQLERKLWTIGQEMRFERGKMLFHTQDLPFPVTHAPDAFATFKKETEHFVKIRQPLDMPELKEFAGEVDQGEIPSLTDLGFAGMAIENAESQFFTGGENVGLDRLTQFADDYGVKNHREGMKESRLSPWISHGCLSPKIVYHHLVGTDGPEYFDSSTEFVSSLLWRDYFRLMGKKYKELIFLRAGPQQVRLRHLSNSLDRAKRWLEADTGIPIIDACMTELVSTGYLGHKGRVLVANYLIHELKVNWQIGAEFFESLLLDYDPCSNYGNWNQVAGVSADSTKDKITSFHSQEKRLDPDGSYVDRWLSQDYVPS